MSHAVFDLALEMPPITVNRVRMPDTTIRWVACCTVCDKRTRPRPLLSAAMRDMNRHGAEHVPHMLARACTQPDRTSLHRLTPDAVATRRAQPLDAVHLTEDPFRKVS